MRSLPILVILLLASGASAERAHRVLVLSAPGAETGEQALMVGEELGSALARQGFSVMTTGDVRSLFRASGCVDGLGSLASVRDIPFQMLDRLAKDGVGVVYGGEVGSLDGKVYLHLVAFDTRGARVVARERLEVTGRDAKKITRRAKKLRRATKGIAGKRLFSGIGGSSGPRSMKGAWGRSLRQSLNAQPARYAETCNLPEVEERFDVVVQARVEGKRVIVEGQGAGQDLFTTARKARRGLGGAVDGMAREVGAEISRVSLLQ